MSSIIDPSKLKVVELRAELSSRGLDTKGNKPVLIQRLKEALEKELRQGCRNTYPCNRYLYRFCNDIRVYVIRLNENENFALAFAINCCLITCFWKG